MKWVTREPGDVEQTGCPWLIRRFIDPEAEFLYVPAEQVMVIAEDEEAIPFGAHGADPDREDERCTFEAILEKYGLSDPALYRLADIVSTGVAGHFDLLAPSTREKTPTTCSCEGQDLQECESIVFDTLYANCWRQIREGYAA